jgi:hypothetical protein
MYNKITKQQKGVATLTVSVSVALLMAVAAVGMMRSGMLEQRIAANDLRMREAQEIAERGMAGVISSSSLPSNVQDCPSPNPLGFIEMEGEDFIFSGSNIPGSATSEEYRNLVLWCYNSSNKIYFVRSQAEIPSPKPNEEPVVKAFVEGWFKKRESYFKEEADMPAPFFVKGDFCRKTLNKNGKENKSCNGNFSMGVSQDINPFLPSYGHWLTVTGEYDVSILSQNTNRNQEAPSGAVNKQSLESTAWDNFFSASIEEAKSLANKDDLFYFFKGEDVINNSVVEGGVLGSRESPVVLILERYQQGQNWVCPKLQIEIFGIVYINGSCEVSGWANAKIYGSIISDGSLSDFNATSNHYKFESDVWSNLKSKKSEAFLIPGTWRDFEPEPQP